MLRKTILLFHLHQTVSEEERKDSKCETDPWNKAKETKRKGQKGGKEI